MTDPNAPMEFDLKRRLKSAAEARNAVAEMLEARDSIKQRIDESADGKMLIACDNQLKNVRGRVHQAEASVRVAARELFEATEKKKFADGQVRMQMRKRVVWVASSEEVRAWCVQNAPLVLVVNGAGFDKLVKAGDLVPDAIAEMVTEPTPTIASDLTRWLFWHETPNGDAVR